MCCRAPAQAGEGNFHDAPRNVASSSSGQRSDSRLGIDGQPPRVFDALAVQDILAQRLRQRLLARRQREIVGRRPAVEGLPEGLHSLRDGEIADPHFAQIGVHIVAEAIEQRLGKAGAALDRLQPPQYHPQMQHQQIKTAVNRVRHAQVPIKQRFSRLRHDHAIDGLNGAARGYPGFPEVIERPKHCGFRKRAPKVALGLAPVAIRRAARYVNASRDARGWDRFRND